eukprot:TRINITY_DN1778_c0_g2_i8.p1 TRINITY_DN1778_c0_g2~~TRINITY_DN1778_c0_g2_i8.p1  ORF type:complete len:142 (+),score=18.47 TRINITY_DN1778_c0_g2_i8:380-805(+)
MRTLLSNLTQVIKQHALVPISGFKVGCAALCESGNIYLGVNLEFENLPLFYSVHGEQFTISHLQNYNEVIKALAVNAAPCGHCRQFLREVVGHSELVIYVGEETFNGLDVLLPHSFGPEELVPIVPCKLLQEINLGLTIAV